MSDQLIGSISNTSLNNFRGVLNKHGSASKSCKYVARIVPSGSMLAQLNNRGIMQDLSYLCEATELPGRGFMSVDMRYYGPSFKVPFQTTYEDINMTFITRTNSYERQFFDDWMAIINPNNTFDFNYQEDYRSTIEIFHLSDVADDQGNPEVTYAFTLLNAWPTIVNPQAVTWADDQILRLGVTFTYHYWTRKGLDISDSRSAIDLVRGSINRY